MASREQLHAVASLCSEYNPITGEGLTASAQCYVSCENCGHFTKEHLCDIDLVDEILVNMDQT